MNIKKTIMILAAVGMTVSTTACKTMEGGTYQVAARQAKDGATVAQQGSQTVQEADKAESSSRQNSRQRWLKDGKAPATASREAAYLDMAEDNFDHARDAGFAAIIAGKALGMDALRDLCDKKDDQMACAALATMQPE